MFIYLSSRFLEFLGLFSRAFLVGIWKVRRLGGGWFWEGRREGTNLGEIRQDVSPKNVIESKGPQAHRCLGLQICGVYCCFIVA